VFKNIKIFDATQNQFARCEQLYEQAKNYTLIDRKIPKIIHQIWLGGPLPEKFKDWCNSWRIMHTDWIYKLWTDEDAAFYPFKNKDLFDRATNFGEKADIWRYELLERFGGVYVDIDEECLRRFDVLNELFDFYVGFQPLDSGYLQLGIAVIGSIAHHSILVKAIEGLRLVNHDQIVVRTGPIYFSVICFKYAGMAGLRDVMLPASYFYPCRYDQKGTSINEWLKEESYAVHHWAGSWLQ